MSEIDVSKLKEVVNLLLDHIIEMGVDKVSLEEQFYWKVSDSEKYEMTSKPANLVVGDLFDDLEFVENVLRDRGHVVSYTLTEVAPILAYLGEVASNKLSSHGG